MCPNKYALKSFKINPFHFKVWTDIAKFKRSSEMAVFTYFSGI